MPALAPMPAPPHIRPSRDKDGAAVLVELLKPGAQMPDPGTCGRWLPVIEAFLRQSDCAVLSRCARGANDGN